MEGRIMGIEGLASYVRTYRVDDVKEVWSHVQDMVLPDKPLNVQVCHGRVCVCAICSHLMFVHVMIIAGSWLARHNCPHKRTIFFR
jgi:hypothetical protein